MWQKHTHVNALSHHLRTYVSSCVCCFATSGYEESARHHDRPAFDVRGGVLWENSERNRLTGEVVPRLQRDRRRQAGGNAYGMRSSLLTGRTQARLYVAAKNTDYQGSEYGVVRNASCLTLLGLLPDAEVSGIFLTFNLTGHQHHQRLQEYEARFADDVVSPSSPSSPPRIVGYRFLYITTGASSFLGRLLLSGNKCPLCEGKGYAYHLFGTHESNHHHHHHHHTGDRCSGREEGLGRREKPSEIPEYAHAVNTTCKVG